MRMIITCMLRVANSTPMVDFDSRLNSLRVNRDNRLLLPTPESPIKTTENIKKYVRQLLKVLFIKVEHALAKLTAILCIVCTFCVGKTCLPPSWEKSQFGDVS